MEKEELDGPPSKKRRLSLSREKPLREANRFAPLTDPDLVEKAVNLSLCHCNCVSFDSD